MPEKIVCVKTRNMTSTHEISLLEEALAELEDYEIVHQTEVEYLGGNFEEELLGKSMENITIFIGFSDNKGISSQLSNFKVVHDKFGIKIGWLDKKAFLDISIDTSWTKKKEDLDLFQKISGQNPKSEGKLKQITKKIDKLPLGLKVAGAIGGGLFLGVGAAVVAGSAFLINGTINSMKLSESQEKVAVGLFFELVFPEITGWSKELNAISEEIDKITKEMDVVPKETGTSDEPNMTKEELDAMVKKSLEEIDRANKALETYSKEINALKGGADA